jgi:hypothetical protein
MIGKSYITNFGVSNSYMVAGSYELDLRRWNQLSHFAALKAEETPGPNRIDAPTLFDRLSPPRCKYYILYVLTSVETTR